MTAKMTPVIRFGIFSIVIIFSTLWGVVFAAAPVLADGPVFVRSGGSDVYCSGAVNVDYDPVVAPDCAVSSVQYGLSLAETSGSLVLDNGFGAITFPPTDAPTTAPQDDLSAAVVNLNITKSDDPDPVLIHTPLTYTVRVANLGSTTATLVSLLDTPPRMEIVTVDAAALSSTQGSCSASVIAFIWVVGCDLGTLGSNAVATVTIVVTPTAAGIIRNHAATSAQNAPNPIEVDEFTQVEGITNLSITKSDFPDPVLAGSPLTYTLTVTNGGSDAAANVTVVDVLPGSVQFNATASTAGCSHSGGTVTCTIGFLAGNNDTETVTLVVTPTVPGLIINTAVVTGGGTDNNPLNNIYTQTTQVLAAANLSIQKIDSPDPVDAGATLTYTVVITNSGPQTATNVIFTDTLPVEATVVATSGNIPGGCSTAANVITCNLGAIGSQQTAIITLQVSLAVTTSGTIFNTAGVTSNVADPDTGDNSTTIDTTISAIGSITISKTADPPSGSTILPGSFITYTVRLTNNGSSTVTEVSIFDVLDISKMNLVYSNTVPAASSISPNPVLLFAQWDVLGPGEGVAWTIQVVVSNTLVTGTIVSNQASADSPNAVSSVNSQQVTHIIGGQGSSTVYLPIIYKDFSGPTITMHWDDQEPVRDKVREQDGGAGLGTDGQEDGLFRVFLSLGSIGPKTISTVVLTSSQGTSVRWDTITPNGVPVLGIFNGGNVLNNANGTMTQVISTPVIVTLYASDNGSLTRFPPELYVYRVTVTFTDNSSLSAEATIPEADPGEPEEPPPGSPLAYVSDVAADPDTNQVFIASPRHNWVYAIDGSTDTIDRAVPVGTGPTGLTVLDASLAQNNRVFVAHQYGSNFWKPGAKYFGVNEAASHDTEFNGYVGAAPVKIASDSSNNNRVYVSNYYDKLAVLDGSSNPPDRLGWVSQKGFQGAYGIDVSTATQRVYLATRDTGELVVFNGNNDRLLDADFIPTHVKPPQPCSLWSVAVNEDTGHVFVPCPQLGKVYVLGESQISVADIEALGVLEERDEFLALVVSAAAAPWIAEITVPGGINLGQEGIAIDSTTDYVFITNASTDAVVVLQDGIIPAYVGTVGLGSGAVPQGIDVNPSTGKVYVGNTGHNTVTVLKASPPFNIITTINLQP